MFGYLLNFWQIRSRGCCRDSMTPHSGGLQGAPSLSAQHQPEKYLCCVREHLFLSWFTAFRWTTGGPQECFCRPLDLCLYKRLVQDAVQVGSVFDPSFLALFTTLPLDHFYHLMKKSTPQISQGLKTQSHSLVKPIFNPRYIKNRHF